jgi:hypothetical protein
MNRAEHVRWCKQRALEYVDTGDLVNALASFTSDMGKHPDTQADPTITTLLAMEGSRCVMQDDRRGMRKLIEGFTE